MLLHLYRPLCSIFVLCLFLVRSGWLLSYFSLDVRNEKHKTFIAISCKRKRGRKPTKCQRKMYNTALCKHWQAFCRSFVTFGCLPLHTSTASDDELDFVLPHVAYVRIRISAAEIAEKWIARITDTPMLRFRSLIGEFLTDSKCSISIPFSPRSLERYVCSCTAINLNESNEHKYVQEIIDDGLECLSGRHVIQAHRRWSEQSPSWSIVRLNEHCLASVSSETSR